MKKAITTSILAVLLLISPVFADLEVPGEVNPVLAENEFTLNGQNCVAQKNIKQGLVSISVRTKEGKPIWTSEILGEQEKFFIIDKNATSLAIKDLNGDKVPEIITAAMTGPDRSALYVYKYEPKENKFVPMQFKHEKQKVYRDFMVSDMYQKDGQDLVFMGDNKVRALGKIYSEQSAPIAGFYYFELVGNDFVSTEIVPVPVDETSENTEKK